ncbi:MAG: hypothetical protein ACI8RD_001056 [Bacillariaceae sp.]|jgi:hypothetical protein
MQYGYKLWGDIKGRGGKFVDIRARRDKLIISYYKASKSVD